MEGRLGRQQFVMLSLAVIVATYFLAFLAGVMAGLTGAGEVAGGLGFIAALVGGIIQAFLAVRRFHDLGRSGWHFWLLLIPLYNLYLSIVLLFSPGFAGTNEYGTDPVT
jgi:uncharacterized membrane protein YhaH (DUF805 family)